MKNLALGVIVGQSALLIEDFKKMAAYQLIINRISHNKNTPECGTFHPEQGSHLPETELCCQTDSGQTVISCLEEHRTEPVESD